MLSNELRRSKEEVEIKKEDKNLVTKNKAYYHVCHNNYTSSDAAVGSPPNQFIEHLKKRLIDYDEMR